MKYFKEKNSTIQKNIIMVQTEHTVHKSYSKSICRHTSSNVTNIKYTPNPLPHHSRPLRINVYWTRAVSMCVHERTLFHRNGIWSDPCVCSNDASGIHDYGTIYHRFHSRIQQQDGIWDLQTIVHFAISTMALKKRQIKNE